MVEVAIPQNASEKNKQRRQGKEEITGHKVKLIEFDTESCINSYLGHVVGSLETQTGDSVTYYRHSSGCDVIKPVFEF